MKLLLILLSFFTTILADSCSVKTIVRTSTLVSTVTVTAQDRIKTVTKTMASGLPVVNNQQMVLFSAFAGSKGCNQATGRLLNDSGIGWNVLTSKGDLRPNQCSNISFALSPGGRLSHATLKLQCKGPSAFVKIYSYGDWVECNDEKVYHGLVFPNGYNCSARHPNFLPLYELSLTSDVCSNRAIPKVGGPIQLEFASVQNVYRDWTRGIGGKAENITFVDPVGTKVDSYGHGVQVMLLDSQGRLLRNANNLVKLSLIVLPGSTSIPWKRNPTLLGTLTAKPIQGVASFGDDLGIKEAGLYKFKACVGEVCVTSNKLKLIPNGINKVVILSQPKAGSKFPLENADSGLADLSTPINVTWSDDFNNYGPQIDLYNATSGIASMNITCNQIGSKDARLVDTQRVSWGKNGYALFKSFGPLAVNIDKVFGKGSVAGAVNGWQCQGQVNMNREWRAKIKAKSVKTNVWVFGA